MQVSQEIQARIIEVAEQLHAENPDKFPTVAEVRSASKADMNSVSIVMKHWRQSKLMPVQKIEETAPAEILELSNQLASKIWGEAKLQAESKLRDAETKFNEERAETDEIRNQLASECDRLNTELEQITELKDDADYIDYIKSKQAVPSVEAKAEEALMTIFANSNLEKYIKD